jgi:hypothetical protein
MFIVQKSVQDMQLTVYLSNRTDFTLYLRNVHGIIFGFCTISVEVHAQVLALPWAYNTVLEFHYVQSSVI